MYGPNISESDWKWLTTIFIAGLVALILGSVALMSFVLYALFVGVMSIFGG